jgi:hypothetical protein
VAVIKRRISPPDDRDSCCHSRHERGHGAHPGRYDHLLVSFPRPAAERSRRRTGKETGRPRSCRPRTTVSTRQRLAKEPTRCVAGANARLTQRLADPAAQELIRLEGLCVAGSRGRAPSPLRIPSEPPAHRRSTVRTTPTPAQPRYGQLRNKRCTDRSPRSSNPPCQPIRQPL